MSSEGFQAVTPEDTGLRKVGIGLLGCGFIGRVHANAYLKIPFSFPDPPAYPEPVALCDMVDAAEKAASMKFLGCYTDWRKMAADPRIKIFDNCTPDNMHAEPTIGAAENGKHVICEKPLAMTVADAKAMLDAVQKAGVKHMVCHNYRFIPAVRLAFELIQKGLIGEIYQFRGCYQQQIGHDPDAPIENAWYASGTKSGVLLGIGSHVIDIARFLVGEISTVSGLLKTFNTSRKNAAGETQQVTADEANIACVEFADGAIGTIESSGVSAGRNNQLTWEVNGTKGSIAWALEDPNHLQVYNADAPVQEIAGFTNVSVTTSNHPLQVVYLPPGHNAGWEYGHTHAIRHFIDCVVNDKPVGPYAATFEDGYKVQVIMEALGQSSREGKKIEIGY